MPPASDGLRTVGCNLQKLVPDAGHLDAIRQAVASTHKATILATELLNMHLRRLLAEDANADFARFFDGSWLLHAYNEVTAGKRKVKVVPELRETFESCMPDFSPPDRTGIQQCLLYDARNLATVAATGVWMHFSKRGRWGGAHKGGGWESHTKGADFLRDGFGKHAEVLCRVGGVRRERFGSSSATPRLTPSFLPVKSNDIAELPLLERVQKLSRKKQGAQPFIAASPPPPHAMLRGCGACCACSASGFWPVPLLQARSRVLCAASAVPACRVSA